MVGSSGDCYRRRIMLQARRWYLIGTLLAATPVLLHCSSDDKKDAQPDTGAAGTYRGLLTGPTETGVLDVTIDSPSMSKTMSTAGGSDVSGSISMVSGAAKISLTGTYDAATGTLELEGKAAAGTYSLTGKSNAGSFAGSYEGPNGSGSFSLLPATDGEVTLYCGSYDGDASGAWNLVVDSSGTALGSHCDADACGALSGTITGSSITLSDPEDPSAVATGKISASGVTGTWASPKSSGTWQGTMAACDSAPEDGAGGAGNVPSDGGRPATSTGGAAGESAAAGAGGVGQVEGPVSSPLVSGLTNTFALSADDSFVYFFTSNEVHRCPVAGCANGIGEKMTNPLAVPSSVVTSGDALFFTHDFRMIDTCATSVSPCAPTSFLDVGASSYPAHLRVSGTRLYWVSETGSARKVQVCPISGCSAGYPKTILDSANAPSFNGVPVAGMAMTGTNLFIASFTGGILRFTMSDPETVDAGSGAQATGSNYGTSGLELDGNNLLWGELNDSRVRTCVAPACMPISDYADGLLSPAAVSATSAAIFIAERGTPAGNDWVAGSGAIRVVRR